MSFDNTKWLSNASQNVCVCNQIHSDRSQVLQLLVWLLRLFCFESYLVYEKKTRRNSASTIQFSRFTQSSHSHSFSFTLLCRLLYFLFENKFLFLFNLSTNDENGKLWAIQKYTNPFQVSVAMCLQMHSFEISFYLHFFHVNDELFTIYGWPFSTEMFIALQPQTKRGN